MKSREGESLTDQLRLLRAVFEDACGRCTTVPSERDWKTILHRVEQEGLSFLTITLPQFSSDFEACLEKRSVDPTLFRGFRKRGSIPAFLSGMIGLLFSSEDGRLHDVPPRSVPFSTVVDSVRQICRTFAKVRLECSPRRVAAAIQGFKQTELDLKVHQYPKSDLRSFDLVSGFLWDDVVRDFNPFHILPAHGPGTTSQGITGNRKFLWREWSLRLDRYFPFVGFAYPVGSNPLEQPPSKEFDLVRFVGLEDESPARVIVVPKTLKSPRIIAAEPVHNMYIQQGLARWLMPRIQSRRGLEGHVNFTDQSINQRLAIASSASGEFATLDLKEASDRVPLSLAYRMFKASPDFIRCILACRSRKAKLPTGEVLKPLRKFASMGNALCFPVESAYFYTLSVLALLKANNLPVTRRNVFKMGRLVYVYGDDLIVPSKHVVSVVDCLQSFGCKVNANKSFWNGNFRESCGADAYDGVRVNPVYVRELLPNDRRQVDRIVSGVATANLFNEKGYWRTSDYLFKRIEKVTGKLPFVPPHCPVLGRVTDYDWLYPKGRINRRIQSREIRGWVVTPVRRTDELDGLAALTKSLLSLEWMGGGPPGPASFLHEWILYVSSHSLRDYGVSLEQTVRRGSVALKRRWVGLDRVQA